MPLIDPKILHGVAFLFRTYQEAENREKTGGTGFLVGREIANSVNLTGKRYYIPYLVSNRHVVWEGSACVAAANRRDGLPPDIWEIDQNDWIVHPAGDDVAATCVHGIYDNGVHELTHIPEWWFVTPLLIDECKMGVGEEVFMVGRFVNHQGRVVNQPAARFGSISMMQQPIWHPLYKRDQESFAVEMRSRTGFSGSPVVYYRTTATVLTEVPKDKTGMHGLLGVNWGYIVDEDGENTWLNGVIPAWKIMEVLETPALKAKQKEAEAIFDEEHSAWRGGAAVPAFSSDAPRATDDNPTHREDFTSLLNAAAKTLPPAD